MEFEPKQRASTPPPDHTRLAELVQAIRQGVVGATAELYRIFYPGACFLIRRRLGRADVDAQARSVLDAAVRKIREDSAIDGRNLPGLVRQLTVQRLPAGGNGSVSDDVAARPAVAVAERILDGMSLVERDALRRCYVLGEPPESFLNSLKLTPDQFRALRLRARAEFSTKTHERNVA